MSVTPGQQYVIEAIVGYRQQHGYAPTFRELAKILGVALATIRQRIRALEQKGFVEHDEGVCRSLRTKERN